MVNTIAEQPSDRSFQGPLERLDECTWRIPKGYKPGMLVDGLIFADERMIPQLRSDRAPEQVANVACLPGIQMASLAMPDIHWGYGFCIGGVCATDPAIGGVVSPGGVGYDINCGVRLLRTNLALADIQPVLTLLVNQMLHDIPVGVGQGGSHVFSPAELRTLMREGVPFLRARGLATDDDVACTEAEGCIPDARPDFVSDRALAVAISVARWARATTSSKCRSSTGLKTRRRRRLACTPVRSVCRGRWNAPSAPPATAPAGH